MRKKIFNNVIAIVSFIVLFFIVRQYGFDEIVKNLRSVGVKIFPIIAVWLVVYLLNTVAFRIVCGKDIASRFPFRKMFALIVSSFGLNNITPVVALGGEVYKTGVIMEYTGKTEATSIVANYYSLHVISHTLFWMLGGAYFIVNMQMTNDYIRILITAGVFIALMFVLFNAVFRHNMIKNVYMWLCKVLKRPHSFNAKMCAKQDAVARVNSEMKNFVETRQKEMISAVILEVFARLFSCVEIMLILDAVGMNITFGQSLFFVALSSLLLNILFFIPMQMGSREGIYYLIMATIGIGSDVGVFISLVTRIREFFWIFIGLLFLPYNKLEAKKNKKIAEQEEV